MKERLSRLVRRFVGPLVGGLGFGSVLIAGRLAGVPAAELTRDVISLVDVSPWTGMLSTAGVLAWAATATIGVFSASVIEKGRTRRYLMALGVFTAVIAVDDQFRATEIIHNLTGTPETLFAGLYVAAFLTVVWPHRALVRTTDVTLLATSGILLGSAVIVDAIALRESFEDLLKFMGAAALLQYVWMTARGFADRGRDAARDSGAA
jgi:hypothetical protein